jgi:hypothetical protein
VIPPVVSEGVGETSRRVYMGGFTRCEGGGGVADDAGDG